MPLEQGTGTSTLIDQRNLYLGTSAFSTLRVAHPFTLTDFNFKYNVDTNFWGQLTASGGTIAHVPAQSAARLQVTGTNGSRALIRTHEYYRYQSGKGMDVKLSVIHDDVGQSNQIRRWGFFDDSDGLFFQLTGTTVQVVRRTSVSGVAVDNVVDQTSWNVDKMDGTGPSQLVLNVSKGNFYDIDFQWLGVGVVRFFVDGFLVHEMQHANLLDVPYTRTAVLPVSFEVVNVGVSVASGFRAICGSVVVDGGMDATEILFDAFNPTDVTVTPVERPILSIRPKLLFNGITNRIVILPRRLFVSNRSGRAGFRIVLNPTLVGAAWTSADPESGVEFDVSATAFAGGRTLLRGFLPNTSDARELSGADLFKQNGSKIHLDAFGTIQPILSLFGVNEGGGTITMRASTGWVEIR
jgi:hypothetical protein